MGESFARRRRRSKRIRERNFPISLFGECVEVVSRGVKPGRWLSERIGKTERIANRYIQGTTPPSYEALMVVLDELRPRKRA